MERLININLSIHRDELPGAEFQDIHAKLRSAWPDATERVAGQDTVRQTLLSETIVRPLRAGSGYGAIAGMTN